MAWPVLYHAAFVPELEALPPAVKCEVLAKASLLTNYGPTLGRPYVDTLPVRGFANMKEMRFRAGDGVWPTIASPTIWRHGRMDDDSDA